MVTFVRQLSWFNRLYALVWIGGGIAALATGQIPLGLVALVIPLLTLGLWKATQNTDHGRVAAVQPADEREQQALEYSFAIVGQFAIMLTSVGFLAAAVLESDATELATGVLLATMLVWGAAQHLAIRRF
ncbi:hypothetical protein [Euzebya tangerina]|uniref:hypothetical protein n=1 Tax=Euzebya tangerina TaxID=591198 RepID=UPI0013C37647|nr:hypothetical protein [Euzebya tangerina]